MPHKRAKRSVREQTRSDRKTDLPPSQSLIPDDEIPKSMARVLNAYKVQQDWRERKRKLETEGEKGHHAQKRRKTETGKEGVKSLKVKSGESSDQSDRAANDSKRLIRPPKIASNKASNGSGSSRPSDDAQRSKNKKKIATADVGPTPKSNVRAVEFEKYSSSQPKRLNDVAQAPPSLKHLPRGAHKIVSSAKARSADGTVVGEVKCIRDGVVSAAQKRMLELEREKAIQRYRTLKETQMKKAGGHADS